MNTRRVGALRTLALQAAYKRHGVRMSINKKAFSHWLPIYISDLHMRRAAPALKRALSTITPVSSTLELSRVDMNVQIGEDRCTTYCDDWYGSALCLCPLPCRYHLRAMLEVTALMDAMESADSADSDGISRP